MKMSPRSLGLAAPWLLVIALGAAQAAAPDRLAAGRALAHGQEKGNCLACHQMPRDPGAETLANLGPRLENVRHRYPSRDELRQRIWDAARFNADTLMPPYGRHRILTEEEIDLVVDYIHEL
jgi:sulfur-oxidizing protein SoxX